MVEAAVSEKLERLEARRFGKVKNPRKNLEDADTAPGARGILAPVRRFVWARDALIGALTVDAAPRRIGSNFTTTIPSALAATGAPVTFASSAARTTC